MAPFDVDTLIFRSHFIMGATELLSGVDQETRLIAADEVVDQYSFWDEDQGFGTSDMTFAIQSFLDNVIAYGNLPYKTQFNPRLEVVGV